MAHCIAYGCTNYSKKKDPNISFHLLPGETRATVRRKWLVAIRRTKLPKVPYLCSEHFEPTCFDYSFSLRSQLVSTKKKRLLNPDAVPTIFADRPQAKRREYSERRARKRQHQETLKEIFDLEVKCKEPHTTTETKSITSVMLDEQVEQLQAGEDIAVPGQNSMQSHTLKSTACIGTKVDVQTDYSIMMMSTDMGVQCPNPDEETSRSSKGTATEQQVDAKYEPSSQENHSTSAQSSISQSLKDQETFLVYKTNLFDLFNFCPKCGAVVLPESIKRTLEEGSRLTIELSCLSGCHYQWSSQPKLSIVALMPQTS